MFQSSLLPMTSAAGLLQLVNSFTKMTAYHQLELFAIVRCFFSIEANRHQSEGLWPQTPDISLVWIAFTFALVFLTRASMAADSLISHWYGQHLRLPQYF